MALPTTGVIARSATAGHLRLEVIEKPEITNITVSGDLGVPIQLEALSIELF